MDKDLACIEEISACARNKDLRLVETKAKIKCFKEGTARMKQEIEFLQKQISELNVETDRIQLINNQLEKAYEGAKVTLTLSQESKFYVRCHNKYAEKELAEVNTKQNKILAQHYKLLEDTKTEYQENSPKYKEYKECRAKLKLMKMSCLDYEQKIIGLEKMQAQTLIIKKQLYLSDIVNLARVWVNWKKCTEASRMLDECKITERRSKQELFEAQQNAIKSKRSNNTKTTINPAASETNLKIKWELLNQKLDYSPIVFKEPKLNVVFDSTNTKVRILNDVIVPKPKDGPLRSTDSKTDRKSKQEKINRNFERLYNKYTNRMSRQNSNASIKSVTVPQAEIRQPSNKITEEPQVLNSQNSKKSFAKTPLTNQLDKFNSQNFTNESISQSDSVKQYRSLSQSSQNFSLPSSISQNEQKKNNQNSQDVVNKTSMFSFGQAVNNTNLPATAQNIRKDGSSKVSPFFANMSIPPPAFSLEEINQPNPFMSEDIPMNDDIFKRPINPDADNSELKMNYSVEEDIDLNFTGPNDVPDNKGRPDDYGFLCTNQQYSSFKF